MGGVANRWAGVALAALVLAGASACGPDKPEITISVYDHEDALTPAAGDNLFFIKIVKTSAKLAFDDLLVFAKYQEAFTEEMEVAHQDHNGDGTVDDGDEILCTEPDELFDESHLHEEVYVFLDRFASGLFASATEPTETLANGVWIPDN